MVKIMAHGFLRYCSGNRSQLGIGKRLDLRVCEATIIHAGTSAAASV
jgi:hypothetical protein